MVDGGESSKREKSRVGQELNKKAIENRLKTRLSSSVKTHVFVHCGPQDVCVFILLVILYTML